MKHESSKMPETRWEAYAQTTMQLLARLNAGFLVHAGMAQNSRSQAAACDVGLDL
jgi:hypothetical protein